jgi:hypothetical protein
MGRLLRMVGRGDDGVRRVDWVVNADANQTMDAMD